MVLDRTFLLVAQQSFTEKWAEAARTTFGFFWSALWAFALGYLISSMIQVFVTHERMKRALGEENAKSVGLATFFGFISSSCSFAALATTRSLLKKGAGFIPSLAFLLSSTNLVIELGIVIAIFLSWQFVVGEYVGGILLILITWLYVRLTRPKKLIQQAKENIGQGEKEETQVPDWKEMIRSWKGWKKVANKYWMEWQMVWKDVTVGFTIAGIISAFVPRKFFQWLFIGTGGSEEGYSFFQLLEHAVVGPVAAFFTFIGSMGNVPLASLLYQNGVSFAGVMAFLFSDLVVFPVLRINAKYYGWRMSLYILSALLVALIASSILLHYGFELMGVLPKVQSGKSATEQSFFKINYTFFLNIAFLIVSGFMVWLAFFKKVDRQKDQQENQMESRGGIERILFFLSMLAYLWLAVGLVLLLLK